MTAESLHHLTGIAVDIAILVGAIAAAIRFRIFNVFGYRWRTDVTCWHADLPDGSVLFLADYVVQNTGRRPLKLTNVTIQVRAAKQHGQLLEPDQSQLIVSRELRMGDESLKGIFQIEPGERTIFPLRARLDRLDEFVFVVCTFATAAHRTPTVFRSFYVKTLRREAAALKEEPPTTASDDADDDD